MPDLTTQLSNFLTQLYAGTVGGLGNGVTSWAWTLGTTLTEISQDVLALRRGAATQELQIGPVSAELRVRKIAGDAAQLLTRDATGLEFGTNNTTRWYLTSAGHMLVNGSINLGDAVGNAPVDVHARGLIKSYSATSGIGYGTGAGGAVTQITSKATGVTLSTVSGQITTHAAALASGAVVSFVWTNTAIAATDLCVFSHVSGGTAGAYAVEFRPGAGSATVTIRNLTAGSLSEAIVIGFNILKGVTA